MNELDLFAAAIAVANSHERAALLDRECSENPVLRARLEELLSAHFRSNPLLDKPEGGQTVAKPGEAVTVDLALPMEAGLVVAGRYKLLHVP